MFVSCGAGLLLPALPVSSVPGALEEVPRYHRPADGRITLHGTHSYAFVRELVTGFSVAIVQHSCISIQPSIASEMPVMLTFCGTQQ